MATNENICYDMLMSTIFTKIINKEIPADIIYEDELVLAFLDINPVFKGHALVIPKKEFQNIFDGDPEYLSRMIVVAQKVANALIAVTGANGINLHMNNGHEAGQDVPHAHIHVIPRFHRDETFHVPHHETYGEHESPELAAKIKAVIL